MPSTWMLLLLAVVAGFAGFAWLALAMEAHWKQVYTQSGSRHPANLLKIAGWLGLLVSAVLCFMADRPSIAILVWIMLLAATAPCISMLLSWRPQLLKIFWPV